MPKASSSARIDRLEMLTALLREGRLSTGAALAAELGVSARTVARDIAFLRGRDLPIDADRGRGGGLRLNRHWAVGNVHFNYREAIDLLLGLAIAERLGTTLFLSQTRAVRAKLAATFAADQRDKIRLLRRRVLVGSRASDAVMAGFAPEITCDAGTILEAFFDMKLLELRYADRQQARSRRIVEPQYLFLNWPVWYLLGWDHLRQDVRFFRLDRIRQAKALRDSFKLRPERLFDSAIQGLAQSI